MPLGVAAFCLASAPCESSPSSWRCRVRSPRSRRTPLRLRPRPTRPASLRKLDELWKTRDSADAVKLNDEVIREGLKAFPTDYEILWRAARIRWWVADGLTEEKLKKQVAKEGWNYARRAVEANAEGPRGQVLHGPEHRRVLPGGGHLEGAGRGPGGPVRGEPRVLHQEQRGVRSLRRPHRQGPLPLGAAVAQARPGQVEGGAAEVHRQAPRAPPQLLLPGRHPAEGRRREGREGGDRQGAQRLGRLRSARRRAG